MSLYRLTSESIASIRPTTFPDIGVYERSDLQRLLQANIKVVAPDVLVISEEFCDWDESRRRIDLLGIDRQANIVVIELKRGRRGGHMELQAIRYASMVAKMRFDRAVDVFQLHLDKTDSELDAQTELLDFLQWDEPREDEFGNSVRIILVAAGFQKELTTSVLWLNETGLDIRCVRLEPYQIANDTILDVQQVIPFPDAEDYIVRVREKEHERREAARKDTGYWFMNTGDKPEDQNRSWEDCKRYGFLQAGGGQKYIGHAQTLRKGDKVFAYLSGKGYVGYGEVTEKACPLREFVPVGFTKPLPDLEVSAVYDDQRLHDEDRCDWCVRVNWIHAVEKDQAVLKDRFRRSTLSKIKQPDLVTELLRQLADKASIS